jgi:hypothetical protein
MPGISDRVVSRVLRWSYGLFIAQASVNAILGAIQRTHHQESPHLVLSLAVPELLAALAFLFEPAERFALAVLLVVYAVAAVVTAMQGDLPLRFLYYAMTAVFIVLSHRRSVENGNTV